MIEVRIAEPYQHAWIAKKAPLVLSPSFRAIMAVEDGQILGMVGYDGWTPNSCCIHIALDKPIALRRLLKPAFALPFKEWKLGVVLCSVLSTNKQSLRLVETAKFDPVGKIADGWSVGVDLHIFEMRRESCRYLG